MLHFNLIAEKYGIENYLVKENFDLKNDKSNLEHIDNLVLEMNNEVKKSIFKHDAVNHYYEKYNFVPPWVLTKILSSYKRNITIREAIVI